MKLVQTAPAEVLDRAREILLAQEWIFARTMPENPHWYTLRRKWASDADFVWTVQVMREYGYAEPYGGRLYHGLLNVDDFKYWTMGAPIKATILINRKPIPSNEMMGT